jgi:hypothetical protein
MQIHFFLPFIGFKGKIDITKCNFPLCYTQDINYGKTLGAVDFYHSLRFFSNFGFFLHLDDEKKSLF